MKSMTGQLRVLGPLEIGDGGRGIASRKQRVLLGTLLLNANRITTTAVLRDALWPGDRPRSAMKNLHSYVHRLRAVLTGSGLVGRLRSHPDGYLVAVDRSELDVIDFELLARDLLAARHTREHARVIELGSRALWHWRGPLLGDLGADVPALALDAARLDELRRQVVDGVVLARFASGQEGATLPLLRDCVAQQPLCEQVHRYLMYALSRCGRKAEALALYRGIAHRLRTELGVQPGFALQRLHTAILQDGELRSG